ncbi:MAG: hypothetical protein HYX50_02245 [Chloroflexi bacterium]|nr:hypothetical protein [Chloroflexota bacterium]
MDSATALAAAPFVTALVAAITAAAPVIPRRAYPLVALAVGIAWVCAAQAAMGGLRWSAPLTGIVAGLAASGLYSAAVKPLLAVREGTQG